jgi:hypothetical protein
VYVIRQDPHNPALLFAGTEFGLFASIDGGAAWTAVRGQLPTVAVHDLLIHPRANDLVVGTHGRGIWILDDITPLEKLTATALAADAQLFPVRPALLFNQSDQYGGGPRGVGDLGDRLFAAPNPPFGALIAYYFKQDVPRDRDAKIAILDGAGTVVRELDVNKKAGLHRLVWDLRLAPPYTPAPPAGGRGAAGDHEAGGGFGNAPRGPFVLPGPYKARLTGVGGAPLDVPIVVKPDPLVQLSEADYKSLYDTRVQASRLQTRVQAAVRTAEQIKLQIDEAKRAIASAAAPAALTTEANAVGREVDDIIAKVRGAGGRGFGGGDDESRQPSIQQRVNGIAGEIGGVTSLPTEYQRDTLAMAATELDAQLERLNQLVTSRVPAFNKSLDDAKVPWSIGRPIK